MPNIKVYSTTSCPYCVKAKDYLKAKGLAFENIDVSTDEEGAGEMIRVSGQMAVPVILIDGDVIVGFDKGRIDAKLGL